MGEASFWPPPLVQRGHCAPRGNGPTPPDPIAPNLQLYSTLRAARILPYTLEFDLRLMSDVVDRMNNVYRSHKAWLRSYPLVCSVFSFDIASSSKLRTSSAEQLQFSADFK